MRWAAKVEKDVLSEKMLKRSLRESKIKEEDIELIIAHLEYTGKMGTAEIIINNQKIRLLKLGRLGSSEKPEISLKETALFSLEENINAIEEKVSEI